MEPLVTICIPTYNSGDTINRTIWSLLSQSYRNIEINVVDNGSTDNTVELVNSFKNPNIKVHAYPYHVPIAEVNWNRCFQYTTGKYSAIFHADDIYKPYMIERQVHILENNADVCAVFTGGELIDENDHLIKRIPVVDDYKNEKKLTQRDVLLSTLNNGNTLFTPSALFDSVVYRDVLAPFRYDMFRYSSDLDMWLRAAVYSHIVVLDAPLLRYRISGKQGSHTIHNTRTSEEAFFTTVDYYLKKYDDIPQESIDKYEMRRLIDKITCAKNSISQLGMKLPKMIMWGAMKKLGLQ